MNDCVLEKTPGIFGEYSTSTQIEAYVKCFFDDNVLPFIERELYEQPKLERPFIHRSTVPVHFSQPLSVPRYPKGFCHGDGCTYDVCQAACRESDGCTGFYHRFPTDDAPQGCSFHSPGTYTISSEAKTSINRGGEWSTRPEPIHSQFYTDWKAKSVIVPN